MIVIGILIGGLRGEFTTAVTVAHLGSSKPDRRVDRRSQIRQAIIGCLNQQDMTVRADSKVERYTARLASAFGSSNASTMATICPVPAVPEGRTYASCRSAGLYPEGNPPRRGL